MTTIEDRFQALNKRKNNVVEMVEMDAIVETLGIVDSNGMKSISVGNLPNEVLNCVQSHIIEYELAIQAALKGDRKAALKAMLMDPLVQDFDAAEKMLNELLEANAKFLPQFFK